MKHHHRILRLAVLLISGLVTHPAAAEPPVRPVVPLDGEWQFRMDPKREGEAGQWFKPGVNFPDKIQVPGNWQAQKFGQEIRLIRHKRDFKGDGIVNMTGVAELDERYSTEGKTGISQTRLVLADQMTPALLDFVASGGNAILLEMNEELSARSRPEFMRFQFRTYIAYNTSRIMKESIGIPYWPKWIRCNANFVENHSAIADFPHEEFPDYQMARMFGDYVSAVYFSGLDSVQRKKMRPLVWGLNMDDTKTPVPNFPLPQEFFSQVFKGTQLIYQV